MWALVYVCVGPHMCPHIHTHWQQPPAMQVTPTLLLPAIAVSLVPRCSHSRQHHHLHFMPGLAKTDSGPSRVLGLRLSLLPEGSNFNSMEVLLSSSPTVNKAAFLLTLLVGLLPPCPELWGSPALDESRQPPHRLPVSEKSPILKSKLFFSKDTCIVTVKTHIEKHIRHTFHTLFYTDILAHSPGRWALQRGKVHETAHAQALGGESIGQASEGFRPTLYSSMCAIPAWSDKVSSQKGPILGLMLNSHHLDIF